MGYYLGLDLSTQQLKGIVVSADTLDSEMTYKIICDENVLFDTLKFDTTYGAVLNGDRVTTPTKMWLRAIDVLLERLSKKVDLFKVRCIGGCAQQHGTVYWKRPDLLRQMTPEKSIEENLKEAFSLEHSPIWMDSSTAAECRKLEAHVGGALQLASLTGSRAYERFSGNQISKIAREQYREYNETVRISLISSFVASVLIGEVAPIDFSDGSGMNLMNIRTNTWCQKCLDGCVGPANAGELFNKLGGEKGLVPSGTDLGKVCSAIRLKFGFHPECRVTAFTGDNPASFVGMGVEKGDLMMSLGSSDTLLLWVDKDKPPLLQAHSLTNPLDPNYLMEMLCFKNGGLMRDRICKEYANGDWNFFNSLLESTPAGNHGRVGVYLDLLEILPPRQGRVRFDLRDQDAVKINDPFDAAGEVRALIEGQLMCKRIYAERSGFEFDSSRRLLVTGGASTNVSFCRIVADVFNMKVSTLTIPNSAAFGGAILAQRCVEGIVSIKPRYQLIATPLKANVYADLLPRFQTCLENFDFL